MRFIRREGKVNARDVRTVGGGDGCNVLRAWRGGLETETGNMGI